MDIQIKRCIVTKIYHSDKSGQDFLTLEEGDSTINISSGDLDLSKVPLLEPVSIDGKVIGLVFNGRQSLKAKNLTVKKLNGSAAA